MKRTQKGKHQDFERLRRLSAERSEGKRGPPFTCDYVQASLFSEKFSDKEDMALIQGNKMSIKKEKPKQVVDLFPTGVHLKSAALSDSEDEIHGDKRFTAAPPSPAKSGQRPRSSSERTKTHPRPPDRGTEEEAEECSRVTFFDGCDEAQLSGTDRRSYNYNGIRPFTRSGAARLLDFGTESVKEKEAADVKLKDQSADDPAEGAGVSEKKQKKPKTKSKDKSTFYMKHKQDPKHQDSERVTERRSDRRRACFPPDRLDEPHMRKDSQVRKRRRLSSGSIQASSSSFNPLHYEHSSMFGSYPGRCLTPGYFDSSSPLCLSGLREKSEVEKEAADVKLEDESADDPAEGAGLSKKKQKEQETKSKEKSIFYMKHKQKPKNQDSEEITERRLDKSLSYFPPDNFTEPHTREDFLVRKNRRLPTGGIQAASTSFKPSSLHHQFPYMFGYKIDQVKGTDGAKIDKEKHKPRREFPSKLGKSLSTNTQSEESDVLCEADDVQTSVEEKDGDRQEAADPAEGAPVGTDGELMTSQHVSASSAQPPRSDPQTLSPESCSRPRSASWSPGSQTDSEGTLRRAASLPDVESESSLEDFTPEFTEDGDDEEYSFHCSCAGLFRCSVTGLLFLMQGPGDVFYRVVPWNRGLLEPHGKKPAGPLFDIRCPQRCVSQLHLPHCEIRSTGGCGFLSVVHLKDDGVEFIPPHQVTDTHVVINITGFSAYGNVKDEDSPPDPVQALVLLFYRPPEDPDLTSFLSVLLLPRNIVIHEVLRSRNVLFPYERYIETCSRCKLQPKQTYSLSTDPEDNLVVVDPSDAEFDEDYDGNYLPRFKVILEKVIKHMKLILKDSENSHSVWERRIYLQSSAVTRPGGSTSLNLAPHERLKAVRSRVIDSISEPSLKSLVDKLLEKNVLTDEEKDFGEQKPSHKERARFIIDTVIKKGGDSDLIQALRDTDLYLCRSLELI